MVTYQLSINYWIKKGFSKDESLIKISEIQTKYSRMVKNHPGKSKIRLKKQGFTDEEIKEKCLTPANKSFWIKKGLSEKDSLKKVIENQKYASSYVDHSKIISSNKIEYYLNRGYSLEESKYLLSDRQRTFSKEKCIIKYGNDLGIEIFNNRTKKWLDTISKNNNLNIGYSKISQEIFDLISERIKEFNFKYAKNGGGRI